MMNPPMTPGDRSWQGYHNPKYGAMPMSQPEEYNMSVLKQKSLNALKLLLDK